MRLNVRWGVFLAITALLVGCGDSGSGTNKPGGGAGTPPAAPASPAPAESAIVGLWRVKDIANIEKLQGLGKDIKARTLTLHADHTFRMRDPMIGGVGGTWKLSGNELSFSMKKGTIQPISAEGSNLFDRSLGENVITYELVPPGEIPAPLKVTVDELVTAGKDEKAYEAKYNKKEMEFDGVIGEVDEDNALVRVFGSLDAAHGGIMKPFVQCYMVDGDIKQKLSRGQTVKIRGISMDLVMGPRLSECEVLDQGPSEAVTISATDLAAECQKDQDAAEKKYAFDALSGKTLIVTGKVLGIAETKDGVHLGAEGGKIICKFGYIMDGEKRFDGIKVGDTIRVVGDFSSASSGSEKLPTLQNCGLMPAK